jgi:hypothetical protein
MVRLHPGFKNYRIKLTTDGSFSEWKSAAVHEIIAVFRNHPGKKGTILQIISISCV